MEIGLNEIGTQIAAARKSAYPAATCPLFIVFRLICSLRSLHLLSIADKYHYRRH